MGPAACFYCASFGHAQGFYTQWSSWGPLLLRPQDECRTWSCGPQSHFINSFCDSEPKTSSLFQLVQLNSSPTPLKYALFLSNSLDIWKSYPLLLPTAPHPLICAAMLMCVLNTHTHTYTSCLFQFPWTGVRASLLRARLFETHKA